MSEDAFLEAVVNLAHTLGWMAHHVKKSARKVGTRWVSNIAGDKGAPDLLLVRAPRVVFAELKTGTKYGKKGHQSSYGLTSEQKQWRDALGGCPGVEWHQWTPSDIDTIAAILSRREAEAA